MYTYTKPVEEKLDESAFTGYMVDEFAHIKEFDHESIYRSPQFNEAMNYFDSNDTMTRAVLLSVNEADQNIVMTSLAEKLYKHITDKVDDIDFGTIPLSKGDVTKIDNYAQLTDCIDIITDILQHYNQDTKDIDTVKLALENIKDRTDVFEKAYKFNIELPIVIYNTIVLSIVSAVSFMIASCIEFIKMPDDQGFDIAVDRTSVVKTKEYVLFKNLNKFNNMCADNSFDKVIDYVFSKNNKTNNFVGGTAITVSSGVVALGLLLLIIPIIRELVFFFYYAKASVSEYFDAQSSLLMINAYNIENNLSRDEKSRKTIAAKQKKIADKFKRISNALKVNLKTGESKSEKEINKLNKEKFKQNEVLDRIPDSSNSILF